MATELETLRKELEYMRSTVKEALEDYDLEMPILSRGSLEALIDGKNTSYTTEYLEALEEVAKAARLVKELIGCNRKLGLWEKEAEQAGFGIGTALAMIAVYKALTQLDALAKEEKPS